MSELSFEQMLEDSVKTIRNGEIVQGTVIDVKEDYYKIQIIRCSVMVIVVKSMTVDKVGICRTDLLRLFIHHVTKC